MRHSNSRRSLLSMIILTLLVAVIVPATALGQGHGRGHGRGGIFGNPNNKCGKFVNCHDASEGRVDGRGPRADRVGNILRARVRRHRNFENDDLMFRNRRLNRNRRHFWRNHGRRVGRRVMENR